MTNAQLANHAALAIPGKIRVELQERNIFVTEALDVDAADEADLRRVVGEIGRAGKLEERRRIQRYVREQRETGGVEKTFRVQRAAALEVGRFVLPIPTGAAGKIPDVVRPRALLDLQSLVRPFRGDGQVRHFVITAA